VKISQNFVAFSEYRTLTLSEKQLKIVTKPITQKLLNTIF
jgi:hypothetical protein